MRQSKSGSRTGPGNIVLTPTIPVLAGSALIVFVWISSASWGGADDIAVSGSGATWTDHPANGGAYLWAFFGDNATGGAGAITVTITDADLYIADALLIEVSGVANGLGNPETDDDIAVASLPPDYVSPPSTMNAPRIGIYTGRDYDQIFGAWGVHANATLVGADNAMKIKTGPTGGFAELLRLKHAVPSGGGAGAYNDIYGAAAWRDTTLAADYASTWTQDASPGWQSLTFAVKMIFPPAALAGTVRGNGGPFGVLTAAGNIVIPPAVLDLPDRWLFGDEKTDLTSYALTVSKAQGADDHPSLRGQDLPWAGLPGAQSLEKLPAGRTVPLSMFVWPMMENGDEPSVADRIQARANLDALNRVLARRRQQPLIRVMPDGTGRVAMAEVMRTQEMGDEVSLDAFGLTADFWLADPWFYGQLEADAPHAIAASGTSFTRVNPGSVRTHQVLLNLLGPFVNPKITNRTNGVSVRLIGTVLTGTRLIIDVAQFTAYLNGATAVGNIRHEGAGPYMLLEPGSNTLVVEGDTVGGTVAVDFNPAYV